MSDYEDRVLRKFDAAWLGDDGRIRELPAEAFDVDGGAGQGDLGRLLGIPMTDSGEQTSVDMRAYYKLLGQAVTDPPPDVERLRALEAIETYKPAVVIASWVTQLYLPGDEGPPKIGSSVLGVDEREIGWSRWRSFTCAVFCR